MFFEKGIAQDLIDIAFDPQTSGGLLLFMPEADAQAFVREMDKPYCKLIGRVVPKAERDVIFRKTLR